MYIRLKWTEDNGRYYARFTQHILTLELRGDTSLFQILIRACKLRNHTQGKGKNRNFPWLDPQNIITLARMQEDFTHLSRAFK
jgi:hypothetical protein